MIRLTPQQSGAQLEDALDRLHAVYDASRLARIEFQGTRARKVGDEWIPLPSPPDYGGCLFGSGREVKFDAKACHEKVYRHPADRKHQLIALWRAHEADAIAGLLVCDLDESRALWIWPRLEWQIGECDPIPLYAASTFAIATIVKAHPRFEGFYVPDWYQAVTR